MNFKGLFHYRLNIKWNISRRHILRSLLHAYNTKIKSMFGQEFKGAKFLMQILFEHNTVPRF